MCPLRFILVFFSAILAGYVVWRTVCSSSAMAAENISSKDQQDSSFKKTIQDGLWVFVDMASGRYLWRNLREMKKHENLKNH
ncbi:uncharacterized protein LOC131167868 [Malania oleifera]|uniref:uncharacterized protein LOC131167868 n=1 Tax=Malania oleifera TaxID=397392 RepID=UPI0025AEBEC7|nr:uncharacterized protein LOC131167868 [Malania oleifera]